MALRSGTPQSSALVHSLSAVDEYEPTSKQITAEQCRSRYKVAPQPADAIKNNKERLPNLKAYAA